MNSKPRMQKGIGLDLGRYFVCRAQIPVRDQGDCHRQEGGQGGEPYRDDRGLPDWRECIGAMFHGDFLAWFVDVGESVARWRQCGITACSCC
jgi:hypothetical protein